MKNSEIAKRLYDMGVAAVQLKDAAKQVEAAARVVADDIADGYAWKRPIDSSSFVRMIQMQKDLEMREALAIAVGANDEDVRGAYAAAESGDLLGWLSDRFPAQ